MVLHWPMTESGASMVVRESIQVLQRMVMPGRPFSVKGSVRLNRYLPVFSHLFSLCEIHLDMLEEEPTPPFRHPSGGGDFSNHWKHRAALLTGE